MPAKEKAAKSSNPLAALKNNNTHNHMSVTKIILTCAHQASAGAAFRPIPCAGIDQHRVIRAVQRSKNRHMALKCCATFCESPNCGAGAENTVIDYEVHPATLSAVSLRPKFGFGRGGVVYPQGRQHGVIHVFSTPTSIPCARKAHGMVFQSRYGAETMTKVNSTTTPTAATLGNTPAISTSTIARQQAIENALSAALYFIRLPSTESGLKAATGRAHRALTLLKHACAESAAATVGSAT